MDSTLCPVAACLAYIASWGPSLGPFFFFHDGSPLTKGSHVCAGGERDSGGKRSEQFIISGHSFRIGVATSAAHNGFEDSTIKTLGCWSCKAFLAYL